MGVTLTTLTKQGCFDNDIESQINTNFTNLNAAIGSGTTGTGLTVLQTSPTLITPTLGVATATSVNGNTITAGTGTLTIAAGKTLTANNSLTLAGTDATTQTFPTTSANIARTDAAQTFTGTQTFGVLQMASVNYIATENGANNAIACAAASGPALAIGLVVTVLLAHSLQAGANTFAYNGGATAAIKLNTNPATDIGTAYVSGGVIVLFYNGTVWMELS